MATGIPIREWRFEMSRDPAIVSTAIEVLREQHKKDEQDEDEEEPGAGGPSRRTLISG